MLASTVKTSYSAAAKQGAAYHVAVDSILAAILVCPLKKVRVGQWKRSELTTGKIRIDQ